MSDADLVERLLAKKLFGRFGTDPHWHMFNDPDPDCSEAATRITELEASLAAVTKERDEAREIVRDTHWMAVRYADGRQSYAPGMCNDALQKAYDAGWLIYRNGTTPQHDLDPQYAREGNKPEYRSIDNRLEAAERKNAELVEALSRANRTATDRLYMMEALHSMLGPIGRKVAAMWREKRVHRVHHSWGPKAAGMTGEERAQFILDLEAAPKTAVRFDDNEAVPVRALDGDPS